MQLRGKMHLKQNHFIQIQSTIYVLKKRLLIATKSRQRILNPSDVNIEQHRTNPARIQCRWRNNAPIEKLRLVYGILRYCSFRPSQPLTKPKPSYLDLTYHFCWL